MGAVVGRIPRWMQTLVVAELLFATLTGCGGNAEEELQPFAADAPFGDTEVRNRFDLTVDEYGLRRPTLLYSVTTPHFVRLDSAIGTSTSDGWNLKPLTTIYIDQPRAVAAGTVYSVDPTSSSTFPGVVVFFNGEDSTSRRAVSGTVAVQKWGTVAGDLVAGSFDLVMTDGDSPVTPPPSYRMAGDFSYCLGSETPLADGLVAALER